MDEIKPPLQVDHELQLYDIDDKLMEWIERFAPFGPGNSRPIFVTKDVCVCSYPYTVGRNHLKLKTIKDGVTLDLIGYNLGDYVSLVKKDSLLDIVYTLEYNRFGAQNTIQGKLKDLRLRP